MSQPRRADPSSKPLAPIKAWFSHQGWTPMASQREAWQAQRAGESGLIQVPTGSGNS